MLCQNQLPPFQAIPFGPKPTNAIQSHSSLAKTNLRYSKPLAVGQNQLPPFQAIPVVPKPTSSISSHSRQVKTDFLYSKPFRSGQYCK
jgi:hypothetical protein